MFPEHLCFSGYCTVIFHIVLIKSTVLKFSVCIVLSFNDLHDFSGTVFQLFCKDYDGICLYHDLHQDIVSHIVFPFCQCHHTAVGCLRRIGMNGSYNGMTGSGAFCYG